MVSVSGHDVTVLRAYWAGGPVRAASLSDSDSKSTKKVAVPCGSCGGGRVAGSRGSGTIAPSARPRRGLGEGRRLSTGNGAVFGLADCHAWPLSRQVPCGALPPHGPGNWCRKVRPSASATLKPVCHLRRTTLAVPRRSGSTEVAPTPMGTGKASGADRPRRMARQARTGSRTMHRRWPEKSNCHVVTTDLQESPFPHKVRR